MIDGKIVYQALISRDARFDGLFYVGVTSTGIYCRPVCPAKPPREKNCRFFSSAEAAEKAAFRPCLRCRPELAPGNAPVDSSRRVTDLLLQKIEEGLIENGASLEDIATQFSLSSRQLRRIVQKELGVSPMELKQTRRLLLAKQLLTETTLPITEIAYASGFASLRRFNAAFSNSYRMPPSRLRKNAGQSPDRLPPQETSTLLLSYRPPYDWKAMLDFLHKRAIKGIEHVDTQSYARTVQLGKHKGWIRVVQASHQSALKIEFTHSLTPVLPALLRRLRNLFDLTAHPTLIARHLQQMPLLQESVSRNPGLRVPGAFDGFEMTVRAILGQQITVKAATTLTGRFAAAFGETVATPFPELSHITPLPSKVATATLDDIASLGIVSTRAGTLLAVAKACTTGALQLEAAVHPQEMIARLIELPGIGAWTAHYIAMRALRWPDAFPKEDVVVRKNLGGVTAKQAEVMSQAWRPWRSYAVMHIWKNLTPVKEK
ncbi:DNA-3-methyladenine glycosylase 2 family protein [Erwinia endophytica]|uniref:AlkA N-terminal domain-containing protein n=1 Tax=Erwinia endophytica TaxID=1563158 RepID=UPI001265E62B|nr:AlkA N-terminal domain-containing protein [Erwinia endophytica]KAB8313055.1 DNA-3-methyladenine glycosylase 2 family protein [Erwinia endophytica]